jgi:hypothetical protein
MQSSGKSRTGKKRAYAAPVLKAYGSVRELTAGTGGQASDGGGSMTMMS